MKYYEVQILASNHPSIFQRGWHIFYRSKDVDKCREYIHRNCKKSLEGNRVRIVYVELTEVSINDQEGLCPLSLDLIACT